MEQNIKLPPPNIKGEFMTALKERKSHRQFEKGKEIPLQTLSDLLWVA